MPFKKCITQMVLMYACLCKSYEFQCPHPSHWKLKADTVCNATSQYHCLFDEYSFMYTDFCRQNPDFEIPGYKMVLLGGLNGNLCASNRYQPFFFWTNGSSQCTFQKSLYKEEGQLISTERSTSEDATCRCDYTKRYSFVSRPTHITYCVPSEEDCSCYIKPCPDGYILNTGYQCREGTPRNDECTTSDPFMPSKNISTGMEVLNVNTESRNGLRRGETTTALTVLIVSVIAAILLICYNIVTVDEIQTNTKDTENVIDKGELQHTGGICIEEVNTSHFENPCVKKQQIYLNYFGEGTHTDIVLNSKVLWRIYITLKDAKITVISGPPGCGKTSVLYHAAMKLGEADNFTICFVSNPLKLIESINIKEKQIFVIDDILGKNSLNEHSLQSWRANADLIYETVSRSLKTKLLLTCRSSIYRNETFSLLKLPHMHCDMLTHERFLTTVEMRRR